MCPTLKARATWLLIVLLVGKRSASCLENSSLLTWMTCNWRTKFHNTIFSIPSSQAYFTPLTQFTRSISEFLNIVKHAPMLLSQDGIRYLLTNSRVKIILLMVIYTLSPFDVLPEVILGPLGLADDSLVLMGMLRQVSGLLINFVGEERVRENERRNNWYNVMWWY